MESELKVRPTKMAIATNVGLPVIIAAVISFTMVQAQADHNKEAISKSEARSSAIEAEVKSMGKEQARTGQKLTDLKEEVKEMKGDVKEILRRLPAR